MRHLQCWHAWQPSCCSVCSTLWWSMTGWTVPEIHMSNSTAHATSASLLPAFLANTGGEVQKHQEGDSRVWRLLLGLCDGSLRLKRCAVLALVQGLAGGRLQPVQSAQPAGTARFASEAACKGISLILLTAKARVLTPRQICCHCCSAGHQATCTLQSDDVYNILACMAGAEPAGEGLTDVWCLLSICFGDASATSSA